MAWQAPKTWLPGEMVTAASLNQHVRDNMNFLKTNVTASGMLRQAQESAYGYVSNATGTADTELTGYNLTIPAGALAQAGDAISMEGAWLSNLAGAGTRTSKIVVGGGTLITCFTTTVASSYWCPLRYKIIRRTATTGVLMGHTWIGTNGFMIYTALGAVDWTAAQTLKIYAAFSGSTAGTWGCPSMLYNWQINRTGGSM